MTLIVATPPRPFAFDTEFDGSGAVVSSAVLPPVKRVYMASEVEALVALARSEAREQALGEAESLRAMAITEIGRAMGPAVSALAHAAQAHRATSADLALAAARVVAGAALERLPSGPLEAALEALGQEIDASPRLLIRAPGLDEDGRERLREVAAAAGFQGSVAFRDEPGLPLAAFALEWSDGRAEFNPGEAADRVRDALYAALAAEGGHAESLPHVHGDA